MLRNIASNLIGTILPSVAALVAVPLLVSHLGMGAFGIFSLQVAALFFFGLSDFGISRAIVLLSFDGQFSGGLGWRRPYRIGLKFSIALGAITAALGVPVGAGLLYWHPTQIEPWDLALSSALVLVSAGIMLVTQAPRAVLEVQQRFVLANAIRGPSAAAIFLGPLVALQVDNSLTSAAISILVTRLVSAACYFWACAERPDGRAVTETPMTVDEASGLHRSFLKRAGWLGLTNLLSLLVAYVDRFVLGAVGSATMVGQYVIAQEVVTKMWISSGAVISAAMPRLASEHGELQQESLRKIVRQLLGYMLLAGVLPAVILIAFGGQILELWLRASFDPASVRPLQIMAVGLGVNTLSQINFSLLQVYGGEQRAAYLQGFNVAFVCIALAALVPLLGINGAAVAFTARLIIDALLVRGLLSGRDARCRKLGVSYLGLVGCGALLLCMLIVF